MTTLEELNRDCPEHAVGVRCGECRGTGEVCTGTIDGTPELFDCDRCGGTGNSLAQQPAAAGEEIMVNTPYDVFTLPLQPSGLDGNGPRFVVHVPGPEAQGVVDEGSRTINIDDIDIDDIVAWADGVQGALGTEYANRVTEREAAASRAVLAAIAACPHGVRRPHECKECADTVPASEALEWAEREFAAARQSPAEPKSCFCDRMYPDSNPEASCGDCPIRDYGRRSPSR